MKRWMKSSTHRLVNPVFKVDNTRGLKSPFHSSGRKENKYQYKVY